MAEDIEFSQLIYEIYGYRLLMKTKLQKKQKIIKKYTLANKMEVLKVNSINSENNI